MSHLIVVINPQQVFPVELQQEANEITSTLINGLPCEGRVSLKLMLIKVGKQFQECAVNREL